MIYVAILILISFAFGLFIGWFCASVIDEPRTFPKKKEKP